MNVLVWLCTGVLYICVVQWGGQRLVSGVFPNLSPSYLLKQELSRDLEFTVGWRFKGAHPREAPVSAALVLGLQMHTVPPASPGACWESELSSSRLCGNHLLPESRSGPSFRFYATHLSYALSSPSPTSDRPLDTDLMCCVSVPRGAGDFKDDPTGLQEAAVGCFC